MKKIVKIFLISFFLLAKTYGFAQVKFTYDANGNRDSRVLLIGKINDSIQSGSGISENKSESLPMHDSIAGQSFMLFPNPNNGHFKLQLIGELKQANMYCTLYSTSGEILVQHKSSTLQILDFDLSEKPSGLYLLVVCVGETEKVWKILKE